ncbi:MAG: hypothetical protein OEO77_01045 [Acidimicrobiia bacterium]|nr:hypothetical protein [Acidimicrobiia bacterium]
MSVDIYNGPRRRAVILVVLAISAVACGSASQTTSGVRSLDTTGTRTTSPLEAIIEQELELFEFSACMRDEGIDVGEPTVDADGNVSLGTPMNMISDHGGLMAAYELCSAFIGGRPMGHGGEDRTAVHDRLVEYAKCVRENGYFQLPDPDFTGADGDIFSGLDVNDPAYQVADQICRELLVDDGTASPG